MNIAEMKKIICDIVDSEYPFGISVFACIKSGGEICLKKFKTNDELREIVKDMIFEQLENKYINEETVLDSSDNIADDRKCLYEIEQDDNYAPFGFIPNNDRIEDVYTEKDQDNLMGLLFKVSLDSKKFWAYQHIYQVRLIKRSKSLYAVLTKGDTYVPLDKDVIKIDSRIDLIIIGKSVITSNISLMQSSFGFEKYIRTEAEKTIAIIKDLNIVSNIEKFLAFETQRKLTNAKKLLKAKNSPVLKMERAHLIEQLKTHNRYKNIFDFDEDDKIKISSQKDVGELVKMLNDCIVHSELTDTDYDSMSKNALEPINADEQ